MAAADEEEDIIKDNEEHKSTRSRAKKNKYDIQIKSGTFSDDKYTFPNYFVSQKSRVKITKKEEEDGEKLFLSQKQKPEKASRPQSKNRKRSVKKGRAGSESDEEMEIMDNDFSLDSQASIKHYKKKNDRLTLMLCPPVEMEIKQQPLFQKMRFMLDCGFNLLVFGVGSKYDILNLFAQKNLQNQNQTVLVFNSYNHGCNMKRVVDEIVSWFMKELMKHDPNSRSTRFPRNLCMHEQIMNIKRQFNLISEERKKADVIEQTSLGAKSLQTRSNDCIKLLIHSMD